MSGFREKLKTGRRHQLQIVRTTRQRCFELPGPHFDFDRSFVRPDGLSDLAAAAKALEADPGRRAMIFGHTDTVGTEAYNKLLSERRARAVLGVLTHDPALWETLHGQEKWGLKPIQVMLNALSGEEPIPEDGLDGPLTKGAVKKFQAAHPPLAQDGIAGPRTRKELFGAYFKKCSETPIDATRFQEFGAERVMGCGEFNAFTKNEVEGEKSRRVVTVVFDAGFKPDPLPCKIADLGPCQANLAKEGEPPPDPENPFFRCKVFVKIAAKCPKGPPPIRGDGSWDVPVDLEDGVVAGADAGFTPDDTTPGTGDLGAFAGASFDVPRDEAPAPGDLGVAAGASFDVPRGEGPAAGDLGITAGASFALETTVAPRDGDVGPTVGSDLVSQSERGDEARPSLDQ